MGAGGAHCQHRQIPLGRRAPVVDEAKAKHFPQVRLTYRPMEAGGAALHHRGMAPGLKARVEGVPPRLKSLHYLKVQKQKLILHLLYTLNPLLGGRLSLLLRSLNAH